MNNIIKIFPLVFVFTISLSNSYHRLYAQQPWAVKLPGVSSLSSPRVADLNEDGVGDVIQGVGRIEFQACDSAIIAFNGKNGEILWLVPAEDQIFGSASLMDITGDGVVDVFIGGRSAELQAINGKTGEVIWRFQDPDKKKRRKDKKWFNFYNPQFVPDQDNDGMKDILISNGGDVMIAPYDPNRPTGNLSVLSSKDGRILAYAPMPDDKEIYMSIVTNETPDGKDHEVVFGTGGETIGGNLYVTTLTDIMGGDISNARLLDSSPEKGYIGPPAWVDVTGDQIRDIIVNSVDGRLMAFDGSTKERIWEAVMPNTEAYTSVAPGYFNNDNTLDIFVSYAQGVWPELDWTRQYMVNGKTGNIEFEDSLGFYQTITPVVANFDEDEMDEALVIVDYQVVDEYYRKFFYNMLLVIDFETNELIDLGISHEGHNMASTPWIGDMDGDGNMDIVFSHSTNVKKTYAFDGMQINRIVTGIPIKKEIKWGAYMGSNYDGVYK
jgi:outer membrane protein assembly factor BamB